MSTAFSALSRSCLREMQKARGTARHSRYHGLRRPAVDNGLEPVCTTGRTSANAAAFDISSSFVQGEWAMTTAQTRVPSSLIVGLAGACALISIVVISILPH